MRKRSNKTKKKSIRAAVLRKTGGVCYLCGRIYTRSKKKTLLAPQVYFCDLEIDHIHPFSRFGPDDMSNYMPTCARCNRAKGAKTLHEYLRYNKIIKK